MIVIKLFYMPRRAQPWTGMGFPARFYGPQLIRHENFRRNRNDRARARL